MATTIGGLGSGNLNFPNDLGSYPFYMSLRFYEYTPPSIDQSLELSQTGGAIRLPIPNSLVDQQNMVYVEDSGLTAAAAQLGAAAMPVSTGTIGRVIGAAGAGAGANILSKKFPALGNVAGGLFGTTAANALQQAGVAVNPFLTVLFKSPSFRTFRFNWKLAPSNNQEASILQSIIGQIKYAQLPDFTGGNLLLTYPNIVGITVTSNGFDNMIRFKPAVIRNLSVNYTGAGQPSFFYDGTPTVVEISLEILEIEYWVKQAFGQDSLGIQNPNIGVQAGGSLLNSISNALGLNQSGSSNSLNNPPNNSIDNGYNPFPNLQAG